MSGFMVRLRVHLEWRPRHGGLRFSIRRAPRHGDRVVDGGQPGHLAACSECSGTGFFHQADAPEERVEAQR